ncbi:hypothetical protein E5676_scaffold248G003300 [Cucumis melo var. makuwa]|uniref:Uncharacterized protein n=2 Tax=Cucumis melo TaxID=3656 RepID=A0A5D3BLA2_CUCMM|nr:hypothetical protein E5676_scaffold248G003300 [Cucumis melo var. makuwa]
MIRKESRSTESLCEKSMLLVANLIKLSSSISFAKTANNEATAGSPTTRRRSGGNPAATPLIPGSKRLQEPQSRAKPIYVTKPGGGGFQIGHGSPSPRYSTSSSSSVIYEESDFDEANVDGWASEYIEKVHKNRKDFEQSTMKKPKSMAKSRFRRTNSSVLN